MSLFLGLSLLLMGIIFIIASEYLFGGLCVLAGILLLLFFFRDRDGGGYYVGGSK